MSALTRRPALLVAAVTGAVLLVTAVPVALVVALRAALREPESDTSYSSRP